jgi:hypothetical protein
LRVAGAVAAYEGEDYDGEQDVEDGGGEERDEDCLWERLSVGCCVRRGRAGVRATDSEEVGERHGGGRMCMQCSAVPCRKEEDERRGGAETDVRRGEEVTGRVT